MTAIYYGNLFSKDCQVFTDRSAFKLNKGKEACIMVGARSLEQHLIEADICQPFYIKEILSKQDWTIFEKENQKKKRKPYAPQAMVGLILYGLLQGLSSLRDLERLARVDLGCMLITDGICPDFSSIGYFIRRHQAVLTDLFFLNLTKSILKITRSGVRSLAGDGTIIEAASSRYALMKQEAIEKEYEILTSKLKNSPENPSLMLDIEQIERASKILQKRIDKRKEQHKPIETVSIHPIEPEAVVQPTKKGKISVPAYKPSVLANEARVVVAFDVDPSNEINSLFSMINKTNQADYGEKIEELLLDGGYDSIEVLERTLKEDIGVLCAAHNKNSKKSEKKKALKESKIKKIDFRYDETLDSYFCPQGKQLTPLRRGKATDTTPAYQTYSTTACHDCPLKIRCTSGKNGRQLKRYEGDELKEALRLVMEHPNAQKRLKKRKAMVEPVFSYIRSRQNLNRFHRKGINAVKIEFSLHMMAYNISRAIAQANKLIV
jgi:transposase